MVKIIIEEKKIYHKIYLKLLKEYIYKLTSDRTLYFYENIAGLCVTQYIT